MNHTSTRRRTRIPKHVLDLFWEYRKKQLSWSKDTDLVTRRILESGRWESVKWLLATTGRAWLKGWVMENRGAGLDPKRLRFWQAALNIPEEAVAGWIGEGKFSPWRQRLHQ